MGLDYEIVKVNIGKGDQFNPDFLAFSLITGCRPLLTMMVQMKMVLLASVTIFESGAILLYLAEKTGMLMPQEMQAKKAVYEWLMWQMGGFGPMLGQAHHFNHYAPEKIDYSMNRYSNEANRLYGVLDRQLAKHEFVAGDSYSIADIAILPWTRTYQRQRVDIDEYPHVKAWRETLGARPAVIAGMKKGAEWQEDLKNLSEADFAALFGTKS